MRPSIQHRAFRAALACQAVEKTSFGRWFCHASLAPCNAAPISIICSSAFAPVPPPPAPAARAPLHPSTGLFAPRFGHHRLSSGASIAGLAPAPLHPLAPSVASTPVHCHVILRALAPSSLSTMLHLATPMHAASVLRPSMLPDATSTLDATRFFHLHAPRPRPLVGWVCPLTVRCRPSPESDRVLNNVSALRYRRCRFWPHRLAPALASFSPSLAGFLWLGSSRACCLRAAPCAPSFRRLRLAFAGGLAVESAVRIGPRSL